MTFTPGNEYDTDLDFHSEYFRDHNYEVMSDLQAKCPVAKSSAWGGHWLFTSYEAAFDACQDHELFSSDMRKSVPMLGQPDPMIPIDIDPPLLQEYRRLLLPYLSPKSAKAKEADLRRMAGELIDSFIEQGEADLSQQLFTPLPAMWIMEFLGWQDISWKVVIEWIHSVIHDRASDPQKAMDAVTELYTAMGTEIAKRRAEPADDVTSWLMASEVDGRKLTDSEMLGFLFLLLLGGMDTTAGLSGNAFLRIDADPALRRRLMEEPGILDKATEEFLRHDTPTQGMARLVTRDAEFHGRQLKKGDRVMLMFAGANRDPAAFDRPDEIDFDRKANRHMAFALGVHRCLGSNFARTMFQVMITEVLRRMPDVHVSGPVERYHEAGDVYALRHLPVRFTPGSRESR